MTAAISSFIAPVTPQATPTPAAPPQNQTHGFAHMLSQRQAEAHDTPVHAAAPKAADETTAPQPVAQRAAAQTAERQPAKADKTGKADKTKASDPAAELTPGEKTSAANKADATTSDAIDPALADWMAALNLPTAAASVETPATAVAQGAPPGADAEADAPAGKSRPRAAAGLQLDAAARNTQPKDAKQEAVDRLQVARESREKPAAVAADAPTSAAAWQAAVERVNTPAEANDPRHQTPALGALGAAAHAAPATHTAEAAAPVAITLATPATAPEFAQSLGVQVSVLARDGVQQAELHLNPTDMGPISVHIALDGTQAQVNFGADSATTRQIIEGGLPELAAALRDAGFTLSGGGVHSQAQGRGEGGASNGSSFADGRSDPSSEAEGTLRRISARVSAGGVDLYA